jgi:hypothetical protein
MKPNVRQEKNTGMSIEAERHRAEELTAAEGAKIVALEKNAVS